MPFSATRLETKSLLRLSGKGVFDFLNALLTLDTSAPEPGKAYHGALLTPQGKVLHTLIWSHIQDQDGQHVVFIETEGARAQALLDKLTLYRLARPLTLTLLSDWGVAVCPQDPSGKNPDLPGSLLVFPDPKSPSTIRRIWGPTKDLSQCFPSDPERYNAHLLEEGILDNDLVAGGGRFFPQDLNLDLLGGVSFTKGCYVGQEVMARMHHKNLVKNRLFILKSHHPITEPTPTSLTHEGKTVGTLLCVQGTLGLGIVKLGMDGYTLMAGTNTVIAHAPAALKTDPQG